MFGTAIALILAGKYGISDGTLICMKYKTILTFIIRRTLK